MIVSKEVAKKLKELGFDRPTYRRYYNSSLHEGWRLSETSELYNHNVSRLHRSAPTTAEALDWIREEKEIVAEIKVSKYTKQLEYMFRIYEYCADLRSYESHSHQLGFSTHPLAESALLEAVIKYVEER